MIAEKYIAPEVEIIEVSVEKGFALSNVGCGDDINDGVA